MSGVKKIMERNKFLPKDTTPNLLKHFRGHRDSILGVDFHPNLPQVVSCGADEHITVWNYKHETRALRYESHQGKVNDIRFNKGGDLMASAGDDSTIKLWVPTIKGEVYAFKGHSSKVRSVCFNPSTPGIIASGSNDKTVKLWSVDRTSANKPAASASRNVNRNKIGSFIKSFYKLHTNWVRSVRFSFDGNLLCSASDDNSICIVDVRSYEMVTKLTCPLGSPLYADFNPCTNHYIGSSTKNKCFLVHDLRKNAVVQVYEKLHEGPINSFAFHPCGDYAVTVGDDAHIKILDLVEGRPIYTLHGPKQALYAVAFSQDGSLLGTAGKDKELLIWEPLLVPYENHNSVIGEVEAEKENGISDEKSVSDVSSVTGTLSNLSKTSSSTTSPILSSSKICPTDSSNNSSIQIRSTRQHTSHSTSSARKYFDNN